MAVKIVLERRIHDQQGSIRPAVSQSLVSPRRMRCHLVRMRSHVPRSDPFLICFEECRRNKSQLREHHDALVCAPTDEMVPSMQSFTYLRVIRIFNDTTGNWLRHGSHRYVRSPAAIHACLRMLVGDDHSLYAVHTVMKSSGIKDHIKLPIGIVESNLLSGRLRCCCCCCLQCSQFYECSCHACSKVNFTVFDGQQHHEIGVMTCISGRQHSCGDETDNGDSLPYGAMQYVCCIGPI